MLNEAQLIGIEDETGDLTALAGGGVTSACGFLASGISAGIKVGRSDMAMILSERPCVCAGLFTSNKVAAAPVRYDRPLAERGCCRGAVVNVGCANACTGEGGYADACEMGKLAAEAAGVPVEEMLVCSTGTIGRRLPMGRIREGIKLAAAALSRAGGNDAAAAILTTDTVTKQAAVKVRAGGVSVTVGGMCKGSGMICPNLATTLCFITTDALVDREDLRAAAAAAAEKSFNRITVDGDQSTNDTFLVFANGAAGGERLSPGHPDWPVFVRALSAVAGSLSRQIVMDGEGATKFVSVTVEKAASADDALAACRAVANSPLFKAACFGGDPNWGRVISAVGNSGCRVNEADTQIWFDDVCVFDRGRVADEQANKRLAQVMARRAFSVRVALNAGDFEDTVYTSDLSYGYVKINGEYTT